MIDSTKACKILHATTNFWYLKLLLLTFFQIRNFLLIKVQSGQQSFVFVGWYKMWYKSTIFGNYLRNQTSKFWFRYSFWQLLIKAIDQPNPIFFVWIQYFSEIAMEIMKGGQNTSFHCSLFMGSKVDLKIPAENCDRFWYTWTHLLLLASCNEKCTVKGGPRIGNKRPRLGKLTVQKEIWELC